MKKVNRIIIHHSATDFGSVALFHAWHKKNGWSGVAYHYVIGNGTEGVWNGKKQIGRLTYYQGSHCKSNNKDSIGVCVVGDFMKYAPTKEQVKSLIELLSTECLIHNLDPMARYGKTFVISGHRDNNASLCPGDRLYKLIPEIRIEVSKKILERL